MPRRGETGWLSSLRELDPLDGLVQDRLLEEDIREVIVFAVGRPRRLAIHEVLLRPAGQDAKPRIRTEESMEYRLLGRTGVSVSPLYLGSMVFGPWGNDDRADAVRIIHSALDVGINFVDTADIYSNGVSEEIVGEALRASRDDVVLATKLFVPMSDDPNL